jgi:hypothetical protein
MEGTIPFLGSKNRKHTYSFLNMMMMLLLLLLLMMMMITTLPHVHS